MHRPSQRSASAIAARCIVLRSAVRLSHDPGAASAGLACLRMSGSPACIYQMADKSGLCSCSCPRAALILGTGMIRHLPESLFCPSRAALVIGAKSTSIQPRSHLDINSALLTRSRLCAWEMSGNLWSECLQREPSQKIRLSRARIGRYLGKEGNAEPLGQLHITARPDGHIGHRETVGLGI